MYCRMYCDMSYIFSCDCTGTGFEGDLCENDIDECGSEVSNIFYHIRTCIQSNFLFKSLSHDFHFIQSNFRS